MMPYLCHEALPGGRHGVRGQASMSAAPVIAVSLNWRVPDDRITLMSPPLSRAAFHQWTMAQPRGRFERVEGQAVAMAPERWIHARLKARVWRALDREITAAGLPCQAAPDGICPDRDSMKGFQRRAFGGGPGGKASWRGSGRSPALQGIAGFNFREYATSASRLARSAFIAPPSPTGSPVWAGRDSRARCGPRIPCGTDRAVATPE